MRDFTQKLYDDLVLKLDEFDQHHQHETLADPRLSLICHSIDLVRDKLRTYHFANETDEIDYFKSVLPFLLALLIYYTDKNERDRIVYLHPSGTISDFNQRTFDKIKNFRNDHREFFEYCCSGKNHMDQFYFLRSSPLNREMIHQIEYPRDPSCPTIHCVMVATFLAHARQEKEIHISSVKQNAEEPATKEWKSGLYWTGKSIDLTELGYALHKNGAFNHGKANLNEIFKCLETAFNVNLGNTYRQFQDIRMRKTGYTIFLESLTKDLRKRIDEMDD